MEVYSCIMFTVFNINSFVNYNFSLQTDSEVLAVSFIHIVRRYLTYFT